MPTRRLAIATAGLALALTPSSAQAGTINLTPGAKPATYTGKTTWDARQILNFTVRARGQDTRPAGLGPCCLVFVGRHTIVRVDTPARGRGRIRIRALSTSGRSVKVRVSVRYRGWLKPERPVVEEPEQEAVPEPAGCENIDLAECPSPKG